MKEENIFDAITDYTFNERMAKILQNNEQYCKA